MLASTESSLTEESKLKTRWHLSANSMQVRKFVALAAAATIAMLVIGNIRNDGRLLGSDYSIFRFASVLLWRGDWATLFDSQEFSAARAAFEHSSIGFTPFPYPPSAAWFVAPLAWLPLLPGLVLWLSATFAAFAGLVCRRLDRPWSAALALLGAPGALFNISAGQNGFLAGALLCGGLLLLAEQPVIAGLLLGLLSYKPQFGLLIPVLLLAGRHYQSFAVAAVTTMVLLIGSIALFGTASWVEYFSGALAQQKSFLETGEGSAITTTPTVFVAGRILGLPIMVNYGIQAFATVLTLGASAWAFRQKAAAPEAKAALAMVGAFLATPYCSSSDLEIVAAAQIVLVGHQGIATRGESVVHGTVWLLPLLMMPLALLHIPIGAAALAALFCIILKQINAVQTDRIALPEPLAP